MNDFERQQKLDRLKEGWCAIMMPNMNLKIEVSFWTLLHYSAIAGFGFMIGIVGAVEVLWILWALVQAAKSLM